MRKRVLSIFLALALSVGLAAPAFAADAGTSAELYTYISEDFPYVYQGLECKVRALNNEDYIYGEAEDWNGTHQIVPVEEAFRVGVQGLAKGEEDKILMVAYTDHDGDGVYDQRLFQAKEGAGNAAVLPIPENGAYNPTGLVATTVNAVMISGFDKVEDGNYAFSAARLHEFFGNNTVISFLSETSENVLGSVMLSAGAFDDVTGLGWYSEPIAWAADKGIAAGIGDGDFGPGGDCTHIQILTFLSRAAGNTSAADYSWAKEQMMVIKWATEKSMIGENFEAGKPCTRAEAVNYIWQAKEKPSAAASNFTDMEGYEEYAKAVDWANEKKITTGVGNDMFAPGNTCNRAYIATFLYRAYND